MRRTKRQKYQQQMHFQEFWDSYAQNKTSEISKNTLSGIPGLLCAEQDVGTGTGSNPKGGGRGQQKSAKVKECCSKTSFSELSTGTGSSPRGGGRGQQKSAKVKECCSKTSFLEHAPGNPRNGCHDPLLGTSPTRAGCQDDVSSQANALKT